MAPPDQRHRPRQTTIGIRPIPVRLFDDEGHSPWQLADILNISHGGLCLIVDGLHQLTPCHRLQLDLRCHPDFAFPTCLGQVRWWNGFNLFTTLGIAFLSPLERIPRLELERRAVRREPFSMLDEAAPASGAAWS